MTFVLENVRSAWNVGAIFRTADAIGAKIILIGYTPKPIGPSLKLVKKTAIGAEETVFWEHFEHSSEVFENKKGLHIAIEISSKSKNIFNYLKNKPKSEEEVFIWFGNEIHGVSSEALAGCKHELHLPMKGMKESLNVANCATTVGYLFECFN